MISSYTAIIPSCSAFLFMFDFPHRQLGDMLAVVCSDTDRVKISESGDDTERCSSTQRN